MLFSLPEIRMSAEVDHELSDFMGVFPDAEFDETSVDTGLGHDSYEEAIDD
jgi:hypothetical protein